jgi:hypothetical protein
MLWLLAPIICAAACYGAIMYLERNNVQVEKEDHSVLYRSTVVKVCKVPELLKEQMN